MKKIIGLVVILAVLVLSGYYGMGVMAEKTVTRTVDNVNRVNGLFADVTEYHRGWFNSTATISWKLHIPERISKNDQGQSVTLPAQDFQASTPITIYHGPVIFSPHKVLFGLGYVESDFNMPAKYDEQFKQYFSDKSDKPKLIVSMFINYLNKTTLGFNMPAFKLMAKQGDAQFNWLGMNSNTKMNSSLSSIVGDFEIAGAEISKDKAKIVMGKLDLDYDLHKSGNGLLLGQANMHYPNFNVDQDGKTIFALKGLDVSSETDVSGDLFNGHMTASLQNVFANNQSFGPGSLELAIRNLDANALARINELASAAQNGSEADRQQALMAMMPELPKLFSKGAEVEIPQLTFTLPQGQINGNLYFGLPAGNSDNPFQMMQQLKGHGNLKVPAEVMESMMIQSIKQQMAKNPDLEQALIQQMQSGQADKTMTSDQIASMQAKQRLENMVQSGVIVLDGKDYTLQFDLNGGQFTVNGKPFNPAMMKF